MPNLLLQMLLRGANGVGYTNYPDNVVRFFVGEAAKAGIDLFRVFDCLNWVENMRVAMDAVLESGKLCEAAICYTGDLLDSHAPKYDLTYYVKLARELEKAGAHIIAVKDMAGIMKPAAASVLFSALRAEIAAPIHFHTHDTSGLAAATVLAAVEAGVDAVDAAMDSLSGLTSQPCLGSLVAALDQTDRKTGLDLDAIRRISLYWEAVRFQYAAFESDLRSGASEVYLHEMPGGQFTNLKEQARSLGLESRWHEVARAYADGEPAVWRHRQSDPLLQGGRRHGADDGDAGTFRRRRARPGARYRLSRFRRADDEGRARPAAGRLAGGHPDEGAEGRRADHGSPRLAAWSSRPGGRVRGGGEKIGHPPDDRELASYLMYPKVFSDFAGRRRVTARPRSCRRRPISTACPPVKKFRSSWRRARPWWCAARRSASRTTKVRCASSSS